MRRTVLALATLTLATCTPSPLSSYSECTVRSVGYSNEQPLFKLNAECLHDLESISHDLYSACVLCNIALDDGVDILKHFENTKYQSLPIVAVRVINTTHTFAKRLDSPCWPGMTGLIYLDHLYCPKESH